mgnify:CR=1 FL=1
MDDLPRIEGTHTLLVDADDTLWENNIYYERAIRRFIALLAPTGHSPEAIRRILNMVEAGFVREYGYGVRSFTQALLRTFAHFSRNPLTPAAQETVRGLAQEISNHPLEILAGVPETLGYLASRHRVILATKGDTAEQASKIDQSGLRGYFSAVEIFGEKDVPAYRRLIRQYQLSPTTTWMVGNSPKSDINPALAVGLNAVFVPHPHTWMLEQETVQAAGSPGKLIVVERFSDLQHIF